MAEEENSTTEDTLDTGAQTPESGQASADAQQPPKTDGDVLDSTGADDASSPSGDDVLSGDDATADEGVPDSYTFDAPEGVQINEEAFEQFKGAAKEMGLSQKQFEALIEYDMERSQATQQQAVDGWNERVNGWKEAARTDKEFGGQNYDANVKVAMKAVEQFGDADLKAMLRSPSEQNPEGLAVGNHPAMLRFLNRIGKALGDPSLVLGEEAKPSDDTENRLRRLYPSMYKDSA